MKKFRFRRFGMSFLPPPGCCMAAMYWRSSQILSSPRLSLSRNAKPPCSTIKRTSSRVGWSPHALISGIETSSMKTVMARLPGGPKLLPPRFSSSTSIDCWAPNGVVAEEKLTRLTSILAGSCSPRNMSAVEVFAVPAPPTISTGLRCLCSSPTTKSERVESIVGTRRFEKSSLSPLGYFHLGGVQSFHSPVATSTKYSKMVSFSPTVGMALLTSLSRR
mmetsp:Transcript_8533/g.18077  ORF Transcript_8533/g.18077 Transcript_8533/m.18077 type:complete len:219 (+) Transcript_8533:2356-3012(+)